MKYDVADLKLAVEGKRVGVQCVAQPVVRRGHGVLRQVAGDDHVAAGVLVVVKVVEDAPQAQVGVDAGLEDVAGRPLAEMGVGDLQQPQRAA
ncbi:MAG: hypothetical protein MUC88_15310 [Planctomycetes bacterium]|nr:hypothetical protein [Planctomycetota bacterium]